MGEYLPSALKECSLSPQYTGSKDPNAKLRQVNPGSSKYSDTPFNCPVPSTLPDICLRTAYCKVLPNPKKKKEQTGMSLPKGSLYKACIEKDHDLLDAFGAHDQAQRD